MMTAARAQLQKGQGHLGAESRGEEAVDLALGMYLVVGRESSRPTRRRAVAKRGGLCRRLFPHCILATTDSSSASIPSSRGEHGHSAPSRSKTEGSAGCLMSVGPEALGTSEDSRGHRAAGGCEAGNPTLGLGSGVEDG